MAKTLILYSMIITTLMLLAIAWEFFLEDPVLSRITSYHESESYEQRFEFVITIFVFGCLSLLLPFILSLRDEKIKLEKDRSKQELITKLEMENSLKRHLDGVIPICSYCNAIRETEDGRWTKMETYIEKHTDCAFTHGICPQCLDNQLKKVKNKSVLS